MSFPEAPRDERTRSRTVDRVHEEAERIAVPDFDWIGQPIGGIIDAATAALPHRHRHHDKPETEAN